MWTQQAQNKIPKKFPYQTSTITATSKFPLECFITENKTKQINENGGKLSIICYEETYPMFKSVRKISRFLKILSCGLQWIMVSCTSLFKQVHNNTKTRQRIFFSQVRGKKLLLLQAWFMLYFNLLSAVSLGWWCIILRSLQRSFQFVYCWTFRTIRVPWHTYKQTCITDAHRHAETGGE